MSVLAVVFTNIFKQRIPNYPLYIFSGLVMFNYLSESTNLAMTSITVNFRLITKVYIPKFVFPISKILSSGINLLMSFVAMYIIILFSGNAVTLTHLLFVYPVFCLLILATGLGLLLSSSHVFFRDTQYLYSVFIMLWMYVTPIFYQIDIIPAGLQTVFRINPMYQIITFLRMVVMENAIPSGQQFLTCIAGPALLLCLGILLFRRVQDKFIYFA